MTAKETRIVKARINEEFENIDALINEIDKKNLFGEITGIKDDSFFMRSVGSILHDFYVAVENTLKIICTEYDENLPEGAQWHILLLKQATYDIPELRPAIISKAAMERLDKYRAFRDVFRNVYGFNLDSARIKELLLELPETVNMFKENVNEFMNLNQPSYQLTGRYLFSKSAE